MTAPLSARGGSAALGEADSNTGPLRAMAYARWRSGRHLLASVREESRLKVVFVSVCALLLWVGGFALARFVLGGLDALASDVLGAAGGRALADLILARLFSVFALAVGSMLVVSNVAVCFALLFRSREMELLLVAPMSSATLFLGRFVEAVWLSSWALAFVGSPFLLTYGVVRDAGLGYYVALALFYLVYVLIPAAIGAVVAILLVLFFAGRRRLAAWALIGAALAVPLVASRTQIEIPSLFEADGLQAIAALLGRAQSPLLPSTWLAAGVLAAAEGDWTASAGRLALLVVNAAFAVWLATLFADATLAWAWSRLKDQPAGGRVRPGGAVARGEAIARRFANALWRPVREPARSLVIKDLRVFWRDPSQWSQFVVFFGLIALYFANAKSGVAAEAAWRRWIGILNTSATLLILATLTTRFVFPLISLEGRRFWMLTLAPLSRRGLLLQKFWSSVVATSAITLSLAAISAFRLGLGTAETALSLWSVAAATLALSGLAVGLGALYPNFQEENPSRIVSGLGGTLNFVLSLGFILVVAAAQAAAVAWRGVASAGGAGGSAALVTAGAAIGIVAVTVAWLALRLGGRHLETVEL
jgi:ABC-2 type transport system permease protein